MKCAMRRKESYMFRIDVTYEQEYSEDEIVKVREMYYETRDYGRVNAYFGDFGLCDDAMLSWAIELGWDVDAVIKEIEETLGNDLYSEDDTDFNFFYEIVNDAIEYIDEKLTEHS